MCRLDYLVIEHEVNIFTDHANLVYLCDPYGGNPGTSRRTASMLMRRATKLSAFRYVVVHLPGDQNVWTDMLTRWAVNRVRKLSSPNTPRAKALMLAHINPGVYAKMDWPNIEDIKEAHLTTKEAAPKTFVKTASGILNSRDVLWVPSTSRLLKLQIIIAAHTGHGGHRSAAVTTATMKEHIFWQKMDDDIKSLLQTCLHCLCTQPGTTIRRPLGHALHADLPNELLHFDFCYTSVAEDDSLYVLVLKDDHSGYVWLVPTTEITAEITADSLIKRFSAFGVVTQWVSDRGSHFKNEVVHLLQEKTKSSHHFTLAYCP